MSKVLVCVAWPYANGVIHLGHMAGSILPPDIFSRYNKLLGNEVMMVSGSDQHGTPITVSAEKENVTPEVIAERFHAINKRAIEDMEIDFSLFTKTHTKNHFEVVQDVFNKLLDKGYLYVKESDQYYCPKCGKFLPDRYVEGVCPDCGAENVRGDQCDSCGKTFETGELKHAHCINCGTEPQVKPTEHYFLKLSAFEDSLLKLMEERPHWRSNVKSFTTNWLKDGLNDRAITRDMDWGVPVPVKGWDNKVIYVWFDAVIGYLSASKEYSKIIGKPDYWKEFWEDPTVKHYYFLGKDNIPFHSIIWPAILMGYGGLNMPYEIPANEYLMFKGGKLSKSRGGAIDIPSVLERFDADVIRYYLSAVMPDTHDSEFTWVDFETKVNNELASNLGNYWHRSLSFTKKNFETVPEQDPKESEFILSLVKKSLKEYKEHLDACDFKKAIKVIMELSSEGNKYFADKAPWALIKTDKDACGGVMAATLTLTKALALMAWPFMPKASETVWSYLGMEGSIVDAGLDSATEPIKAGLQLKEPVPVFKKIEVPKEWKDPDAAKKEEKPKQQNKPAEPLTGPFADFRKLEIRVAQIVWIDDHPDADKLYQMKVDVGEDEPRSIVAGLKAFYTKDQMLNRKVLCLANLKPRKLRGIESKGMLLAADDEDIGGSTVLLLKPSKDMPNGTRIDCGLETRDGKIEYEDFAKVKLKVASIINGKFNIDGGKDIELPEGAPSRLVAVVDTDGKLIPLSDAKGCIATVDKEITDGANVR
ncbi:MAG: methionine--tRNA ligase [Candidatus Methanomethylophilaceae archaeon]|nr:methionine--tRNA ligase [Candidatus Methanomethylophilaceae archaeon]